MLSLDKFWGLERTGGQEVMLAGQVLIEAFGNLTSYGLGLRGKRKHKGIPIWQGLICQFHVCPYLV